MYHYSGDNNAQWPGSYCWPEGFRRRLAQYGGATVQLLLTPELVLDMRNAAKTLVTQINIGRRFNEEGVVPRLGPDVPQWFGETVGFWDGDALISWTSNVQGWISHGGFEYSSKLQSIEIYTPRHDAQGTLIGLKHEVVLYDPEALVEPVRIVHLLDRLPDQGPVDPLTIMECIPQSFPASGVTTPMSPGQMVEYRAPDIFGRPWAKIWEEYRVGLHPLRNGHTGGGRGESGFFQCPAEIPPAAGKHCDSVAGSVALGKGVLPVPVP